MVQPPSSWLFWFGEPVALTIVDYHLGPRHPWLVPPVVCMPGPRWPFIWTGHAGERSNTHYPTLHMHSSARGVAAPLGNVLSQLPTIWG